MRRQPSAEEVDAKLIELAYIWGDIEERVQQEAGGALFGDVFEPLAVALGKAFRVEAQFGENDFHDPCTWYVLFYDLAEKDAREASKVVEDEARLRSLITDMASPWHTRDFLAVRRTSRGAPVGGQICRRLGEEHSPQAAADLSDIPAPKPDSSVELVERDGYWLTPIEVPFYDALCETSLSFAVQPWIQAVDRRFRLDFLVLHDGGAVAVELDGHEWHKTKEQRGRDAARDRWFAARRITTLRFTGSQVHADPQGCVQELLAVLRGAQAGP